MEDPMIPFNFAYVRQESAESSAIMDEIFRLRFKVYCEEWGFEKPEDFPKCMESNEFDTTAEHFIIRNTSDDMIVGTARVICPSGLGYPVLQNCIIQQDTHDQLLHGCGKTRIGEVSRLAISKDYRKRIEDNSHTGYTSNLPDEIYPEHEKRRYNFVHEFYKYLLLQSIEMGFTHWYVAMKRGLFVLLKQVGMVYHPIGPEIDYHGLRTPYLGNLEEIRKGMLKKDPCCFDLTNTLCR